MRQKTDQTFYVIVSAGAKTMRIKTGRSSLIILLPVLVALAVKVRAVVLRLAVLRFARREV
jgi:hypothetical protein